MQRLTRRAGSTHLLEHEEDKRDERGRRACAVCHWARLGGLYRRRWGKGSSEVERVLSDAPREGG